MSDPEPTPDTAQGLVLNQGEANFIISHSESSIAKWRRTLDQAVSHHDIVKREHAAGAIAAIEALIEKVKAATVPVERAEHGQTKGD